MYIVLESVKFSRFRGICNSSIRLLIDTKCSFVSKMSIFRFWLYNFEPPVDFVDAIEKSKCQSFVPRVWFRHLHGDFRLISVDFARVPPQKHWHRMDFVCSATMGCPYKYLQNDVRNNFAPFRLVLWLRWCVLEKCIVTRTVAATAVANWAAPNSKVLKNATCTAILLSETAHNSIIMRPEQGYS